MTDWIAHHGKGYPFELFNEDGSAKDQPTVLARIRVRDRKDVEQKGHWMPATSWREWKHDGGPGDLMEYKIK